MRCGHCNGEKYRRLIEKGFPSTFQTVVFKQKCIFVMFDRKVKTHISNRFFKIFFYCLYGDIDSAASENLKNNSENAKIYTNI